MLDSSSRYAHLSMAHLERTADGRTESIAYLPRRVVPEPDGLIAAEHIVTTGERLDHITARHLKDPRQFWRIADAHRILRPDDLTAHPGRRIHITIQVR